MTGLAKFKLNILFVLLAGYLLFDYAFMQLRLPPTGLGIPVGELFLIFALLTTDVPLALIKLSSVVYLLPFLVWWVFGLARAVLGSTHYGLWALRDATQVLESLYLIVGFTIAGTFGAVEDLKRRLPMVLAFASIYGLAYPFQAQINAISPSLGGGMGERIPIFGDFVITATVILWTAFYCLVAPLENRILRRMRVPISGFLIAFVVLVIQSRTTYLQLLGIAVILAVFRRRALGSLLAAIPILFIVLGTITLFDLHIAGRLTDKITFSFLVAHVEAIFGIGINHAGNLGAAAEGVAMRLAWWEEIYGRLTADLGTLLTGLGYGIPLTHFRDDFGVIVREPHNSYISVVARLGVLGFVAWAWMQVELFKGWRRAYRGCRQAHWQDGETLLLMILAFAVLVLIDALGEDALEKPYHAIPLYTLWGVALRIAYVLSAQASVRASTPWPRQRFARTAGPRAAD